MATTYISKKTRIEAVKALYPRDDGSSVTFEGNPGVYKAVVDYLSMQEMERDVKAAKEDAALEIKEAMKNAAEATVIGPEGNIYRITWKAVDVAEEPAPRAAFVRRSLSVKKNTTPD
jgi:hypothetical protein